MSETQPLLRRPQAPPIALLGRREREVAAIVYGWGRGITAEEVRIALGDPLSNSAVRSMLGRLAAKGLLRARKTGKKFHYLPAIADDDAREAAILRLAQDYFAGSLAEAAMAMLALARRPSLARASTSRPARPERSLPASSIGQKKGPSGTALLSSGTIF